MTGTDPSLSRARPGRHAAAVLGGAFVLYLVVAVVLWWHVWSSHPSTVTTCGCGDSALFLWFLEWPAYALAHGHNPFFSTALFHPGGIDLLSNTSVLAVGIPLAPITWLFGPVATLNVASTLGPALTALAMFWLLRRWVRWTPAAFVGGLVFGFSPFAVVNLAGAHLMTGVLVFVPLIIGCLDELLLRQQRSARAVGGALGLLVCLQFFLGTEVLVMVALATAVGIVLLVAYGLLRRRGELAERAPHAARGLGVGALLAAVLLAYPVWFALDGPAHLSGLVWPSIPPGSGGITFSHLWHLTYMQSTAQKFFSGYQGPGLPAGEYLGAGVIVVLLAGVVAWRRDRRLWFFGAMGAIALVASLGDQRYWTPWRLVTHVPLVDDVLTGRLMAVVTACVAVMLAVIVDRTRDAVGASLQARRPEPSAPGRSPVRLMAAAAAIVVAAVAVVPMGAALASNTPITTRAVSLPAWFRDVAPHLPPGQVVLTFPPPGIGASTLAWQAVDRLHYAAATGAGPQSILSRAGPERAGQAVISAAAFPEAALPPASTANVAAIRSALAGWGVTVIAVPQSAALLPPFRALDRVAWALGMFTLALNRAPVMRGGTWVWTGVSPTGIHTSISRAAFDRCTDVPSAAVASFTAVPGCVLRGVHEG